MGNELLIGARRVINEQAKELKESKERDLSLELSLLEIDETAPTHHQDNTLKINGIL